MIDHEMQHAQHPVFWWNIKVLSGAVLIALLLDRYLIGLLTPLGIAHELLGQVLVSIGGVGFVIHYRINRARTLEITSPRALVSEGGLYRYVRHPMYLADVVMYLGFLLMAPSVFGLVVYLVSLFALYRQARVEDAFVASLFPDDHEIWRQTTGLLWPKV